VRQNQDFKEREKFEIFAADHHEEYLMKAKHIDLEGELQLHVKHSQEKLKHELTEAEVATLRSKLFERGLQEPSQTLVDECARIAGLGAGATLAQVAQSFRKRSAEKVSQGLGRMKRDIKEPKHPTRSTRDAGKSASTRTHPIELEVLLEQGFDEDLAEQALACCLPDLSSAIDFCVAHQNNDKGGIQQLEKRIKATEHFLSAKRLMQDSYLPVYNVEGEASGSTFIDLIATVRKTSSREWIARETSLCKRRLASRITSVTVPGRNLLDEYKQRATQQWPGVSWTVVDFGVKAGRHTNACFWLCLAAGWSRCLTKHYATEELQRLYDQARTIPLGDLRSVRTTGSDVLGTVADGLRQFFCGLNGVMLRDDVMALYAPIFAACDAVHGNRARPAALESYKRWIANVATGEFADELILAAAAKWLGVCITTVPHTPHGNNAWTIAQHPEQELWPSAGITDEIIMGNNDVHYVWLTPD
jgi:hypothetical protein